MQAGTIVGNLASAIGITTEDAALVADLKAGSESAFALLIAQYHQPIYSLIARSLNDPADAADITQEVFIKVFRSIRGFHGEASLRTWLYRIALREASNQRRWWSRHKKQEITIDSTGGPYTGPQICQALAPESTFDLRHPILGLWMIDQDCAGMGIRESANLITGNFSSFVPHYFL